MRWFGIGIMLLIAIGNNSTIERLNKMSKRPYKSQGIYTEQIAGQERIY